MTINFEQEYDKDLGIDYREIAEKVINYALDYENCPYEAEISITLTDNNEIHRINNEFREIDRPTDVLSFPLVEYDEAGEFDFLEEMDECFNPDTGELMLGDIIISLDKVEEQAKEYGHSFTREYAFLIAHSMLHLMGYDHMEDDEAEIMIAKQTEILEALNITRDGNDNKALITEALKAMEKAYAPYSKFKVGAAIETANGKIYSGCNVENASYGATICAERCAALKAVSEGEISFKRIAIVSSSGEFTYPCGICRQFLAEFFEEDGSIILYNGETDKEISFWNELPNAFTGKNIK